MTSLLSPNTATVAAAPDDPMPNPLAATPPAPTETTGMDLYSPAPAAASTSASSSAPMPSSSSPTDSDAEPLSGYADSSSPNISYMPNFSGQAGGASSSGSSIIPSSSSSSSSSSGGNGDGSSSSSSVAVAGFAPAAGGRVHDCRRLRLDHGLRQQPGPAADQLRQQINNPRPTVVGTGHNRRDVVVHDRRRRVRFDHGRRQRPVVVGRAQRLLALQG